MKRIFHRKILKGMTVFVFMSAFFCPSGHASRIAAGVNMGIRTLNDEYLNSVYGSGSVVIPYAQFMLAKWFSIEAAFEGGYKKSAPIGIYEEASTLKISGWEFSGILHYEIGRLEPYLKFGAGYYGYKQEIESAFVPYKVDHHHTSFHFGGGSQVFFGKYLYLGAEVKYVQLKVMPFDIKVDLGGLRYLLGLGLKFDW
jgi:hypothetical protein